MGALSDPRGEIVQCFRSQFFGRGPAVGHSESERLVYYYLSPVVAPVKTIGRLLEPDDCVFMADSDRAGKALSGVFASQEVKVTPKPPARHQEDEKGPCSRHQLEVKKTQIDRACHPHHRISVSAQERPGRNKATFPRITGQPEVVAVPAIEPEKVLSCGSFGVHN